jgi:uridine kinase
MTPTFRSRLLDLIGGQITQTSSQSFLKVAIDGVDGAGKTTFADELASVLRDSGKEVIRASVDGFHHPRTVRYRQGRDSPVGFFHDSYDYQALKALLLDPLSPGGSGVYQLAAFDCAMDAPLMPEKLKAKPGAILVLDGIFLHRQELLNYWDFSVFLDVRFEISIPRGAQRGPGFGSPDPGAKSNQRYILGQELYLRECAPKRYATVVVDNNDLAHPKLQANRGLNKKTFAQKWEQAWTMREMAWSLKAARLRSRHPEWAESQVQDSVRKTFIYGST